MSWNTNKTIDYISNMIYNTDNSIEKTVLIRARSCLYKRYIIETNDKYLQDLLGIVFEGLRTWLSGEFTNTQYQAKPIQRQKSKSEAKIEDAPLDFLSSSGTGIL
jgi:hypothetical protein